MILALDLYFKLPFGRLNRTTKEVRELAKLINRTDILSVLLQWSLQTANRFVYLSI